MNGRPAYSSYLPSAYLAELDGLLDHLIQMFETMMAGREEEPIRPLMSWVEIENLDPGVRLGIQGASIRARYNERESRLEFSGVMTAADLAAVFENAVAGRL